MKYPWAKPGVKVVCVIPRENEWVNWYGPLRGEVCTISDVFVGRGRLSGGIAVALALKEYPSGDIGFGAALFRPLQKSGAGEQARDVALFSHHLKARTDGVKKNKAGVPGKRSQTATAAIKNKAGVPGSPSARDQKPTAAMKNKAGVSSTRSRQFAMLTAARARRMPGGALFAPLAALTCCTASTNTSIWRSHENH